jgi:hypothetical protein
MELPSLHDFQTVNPIDNHRKLRFDKTFRNLLQFLQSDEKASGNLFGPGLLQGNRRRNGIGNQFECLEIRWDCLYGKHLEREISGRSR